MRGKLVAAWATCPAVVWRQGPLAAPPPAGWFSAGAPPATWHGGPSPTSTPPGVCVNGDPACDTFDLAITPAATGSTTVDITVTASPGNDFDLYVYGPDGTRVGSSASDGTPETVTLTDPTPGTYSVKTLAWLVNPGSTYDGTATLKTVTAPTVSKDSVLYTYDKSAPQASVDAPLRVVAVGFKPGELDAAKVLGEIPDVQEPGVLIPHGTSPSPDEADFPFGASTLVNHGRAYYSSTKPFLVPYAYHWKPQLVYASDAFAQALYAQMVAHSTTGDFTDNRMRSYLEQYNADRGVYRGTGNVVAPNAPVRFVDAESTENWIAANSKQYLGFDSGPQGGKSSGPGANPGYTVYLLNTWD